MTFSKLTIVRTWFNACTVYTLLENSTGIPTWRPVHTVIGSDIDQMCIACNWFQSSLIASTLLFCKANHQIPKSGHVLEYLTWLWRDVRVFLSNPQPLTISIYVVALVQWKCKQAMTQIIITFHSNPLSSHLQKWIGSTHILSGLVFLICSADLIDVYSMHIECAVRTQLMHNVDLMRIQ